MTSPGNGTPAPAKIGSRPERTRFFSYKKTSDNPAGQGTTLAELVTRAGLLLKALDLLPGADPDAGTEDQQTHKK